MITQPQHVRLHAKQIQPSCSVPAQLDARKEHNSFVLLSDRRGTGEQVLRATPSKQFRSPRGMPWMGSRILAWSSPMAQPLLVSRLAEANLRFSCLDRPASP